MTQTPNPLNGIAQGAYGMGTIMEGFYGYQPSEDDAEGRAIKNTFAANMIQSAFDSDMATAMAYTNQEIASAAMNQAASLEALNQAQVMQDEFDYGMKRMGAEYDYQSRFAVDEANRQLNAEANRGDIQQNQTRLEGDMDVKQLKKD